MSLAVVYHPDYEIPLKPGHRFPMSSYGYLRRRLAASGLVPEGAHIAPGPAPRALIGLAHEAGYVDRVFSQTLTPEETRRIGLPNTEAMTRRVRLSSAGTLLAARLALEHGLALNAAGGSHHAARSAGSGYCVLNDVAVAAAALLAEGAVSRILVLDLDVHQGDGTARIFQGDPTVFTLSLHGAKNFPARKAVSDMDIALPDGTGDAAYLAALDQALAEAEARFSPDLIIYNAGVDPYKGDRLGRLSLTAAGLRARDARAFAWARHMGAPIVAVMGGGYGEDPDEVAARRHVIFEEAARAAG